MKRLNALILTSSLFLLGGCATIVGSVNEDPIRTDPTERSWGNLIDDQTIETIAAVNINKADERFKDSRIKIVSFNGTVLLIGQVSSNELKRLAEETAGNVKEVDKVYNELTLGSNASLLEQSNDSWLTTKVKANLIQSEEVSADRIKINTEKGTVYLMGLTTPRQAQAAVDIARNTGGVQKIVKVFEYIQ
ncbi:BON domain-containing protein [Endozoicomonas sp. ALD040]|uniref:BON domain-containing protein n=1 Tax=unclassified Endozoicomonas TaxID=2644528 RepID=UPI003BB046AC